MSKVIKSLYAEQTKAKTKTIEIRNLFEEQSFQTFINEQELQEDNELLATEPKSVEVIEEQINQMLLEAEEQAKQIIVDAEEQSKLLHSEMEQRRIQLEHDIEHALTEAKQRGFNQGFEQGKEAGHLEYLNHINEAKNIVQHAETDYLHTIEQAEPTIIELATSLCDRMIGSKLKSDEELWSSMLKQVMIEVREHENVKIYVHPLWFEKTLQQKDELQRLLSHTEKLYIYPDAGLDEQGCIVETKFGRIDATIDSQLTQLKTQLLEKIKEA